MGWMGQIGGSTAALNPPHAPCFSISARFPHFCLPSSLLYYLPFLQAFWTVVAACVFSALLLFSGVVLLWC